MTHITNFSRFVCLLLVCLLLFWSIATPVYAVEPVSMTLIGVSAVCVVGAILIGLGVRPFVETSLDGFNALVNDIVANLPAEFLVANTLVGLAAKMIFADGITYAPRNLIEYILSYIAVPADTAVAPAVSSVFVPSESSNLPYSYFYNQATSGHTSSTNNLYTSLINKMSYCQQVRLNVDAGDGSFFTSYGYLWYNTAPIFEALTSVFVGGKLCDYAIRINCENSDFVFVYSGTGVADGRTGGFYYPGTWTEYYLDNVRFVKLNSNVYSRDSYTANSSSLKLDDYFSASLDKTWASNGVAVPGSIAAPDVVAVPVSVPATVSDAVTRSRADTISGTKTVAETVTLTETGTNTGTSTGTASLWDTLWGWLERIWNAIKSLVSGITVPIVNAVTAVKTRVASIADVFTGTVAVASPVEAIRFGALLSLFPFNIPYGIYKAVTLWGSAASAPTITVPLPTFSGGSVSVYEYEINVSEIPGMDKLAAIIRAGELILFILGLGLITRKVTKW